MTAQHQTNMQKAMFCWTAVLILITAVRASEHSGDLTSPTPHPAGPAPMHTLNGGEVEPRALKMSRPCREEHANYCVHGQCMYPQDRDEPSCQCLPGYTKDRCVFYNPPTDSPSIQSGSGTEEVIGMVLGVAFLLGFLGIAVFCCLRKRCKTPPYKPYSSQNSV